MDLPDFATKAGRWAGLRSLDLWVYSFGNSEMLNESIHSGYNLLFSIAEHVIGYGWLISRPFNSPADFKLMDVVTADVVVRDLRWVFGEVVDPFYWIGRQPGIVGTVRDLGRLVKRTDAAAANKSQFD